MKTEELMLKNRNGKRMPATLQLPAETIKGTVVIFHGLAGWKDQRLIVKIADSFAQQGYAVLRFDESDGVTSPDGDPYNETTTKYTRDAEDVLAYVSAQSWGAHKRIFVGHSMGGLVATWCAARHPEEVSHLILLAPAVSSKLMRWNEFPFSLAGMIRRHRKQLEGYAGWDKFRLSPWWWIDFQRFNAAAYARKIEMPTLVISAEQDATVANPSEHREYTKQFPHAEHSTITWANHDFDGHEDEVADTITQWLTSS